MPIHHCHALDTLREELRMMAYPPHSEGRHARWLEALDALLAELRQAKADAVACWRAWAADVSSEGDCTAILTPEARERLRNYVAELAGEEKG